MATAEPRGNAGSGHRSSLREDPDDRFVSGLARPIDRAATCLLVHEIGVRAMREEGAHQIFVATDGRVDERCHADDGLGIVRPSSGVEKRDRRVRMAILGREQQRCPTGLVAPIGVEAASDEPRDHLGRPDSRTLVEGVVSVHEDVAAGTARQELVGHRALPAGCGEPEEAARRVGRRRRMGGVLPHAIVDITGRCPDRHLDGGRCPCPDRGTGVEERRDHFLVFAKCRLSQRGQPPTRIGEIEDGAAAGEERDRVGMIAHRGVREGRSAGWSLVVHPGAGIEEHLEGV